MKNLYIREYIFLKSKDILRIQKNLHTVPTFPNISNSLLHNPLSHFTDTHTHTHTPLLTVYYDLEGHRSLFYSYLSL